MSRLPKLFAKFRFRLPSQPQAVFAWKHEADFKALLSDWSFEKHAHVMRVPWNQFWIEFKNFALYCDIEAKEIISIYDRGRDQDRFAMPDQLVSILTCEDDADATNLYSAIYHASSISPETQKAREYEVGCIIAFQAWATVITQEARPASVNTLTRNGPSIHVRKGDTISYARQDSLMTAAGQSLQRGYEPPEEPSGIKKREHDVRGHWRTYASGVRVWVRSHTRGDPELGRVTRVIG